MTDEPVRLHTDGPVAVLELRRPSRRNAINLELADALERRVRELNDDGEVRAAVLGGDGPSFCAGADMKERLESAEGSARVFRAVRRAARAVSEIRIPVVAAVHGHALGGGLELATMCDYRVLERGTTVGVPEVQQGITSGGGILALASLLPRGALARLAYGAGRLDASDAHALGVVDELVDEGQGRPRALALAQEFAQHPRAALVASKTAVRAAIQPQFDQQWQLLGLLQETLEGGPAQREALERLRRRRS